MRQPRLLFFVTEDWYFCSHRLPLAVAAREAGYEVVLITRVDQHADILRKAGIRLIPIELSRQGTNPLRELALIARLIHIYRRERPDILHHVAMKPVLYGSLAARFCGQPRVVNALAGLGFLFSSTSTKARLLRPLVRLAFSRLLNGGRSCLIVQNPDDQAMLTRAARLDPHRVHLIRGSGVDLDQFRPGLEPTGPITIMLPSRLLWDKGVGEFAAAAERYKQSNGGDVRFVLLGKPDPGNPAAVPGARIQDWVENGTLEWWGHSNDMPKSFSHCHIVCLPTYYGEGLPKVLIEAAACGLPIVATDVPGCREVVRDGENGLLVPARSVDALVTALSCLIQDPTLRLAYGRAGRGRAEAEFGIGQVVNQTLEVYAKVELPLK